MKMKLESWLKHHSASKSKFNLEILHTLKDLHLAGLFLFLIINKALSSQTIITQIQKKLILLGILIYSKNLLFS